jgi:hypothetical protein
MKMVADAENLVLEHLRHIRAAVDRTEQRLDDLTTRVGRIETNIGQIYVTLAEHSTTNPINKASLALVTSSVPFYINTHHCRQKEL